MVISFLSAYLVGNFLLHENNHFIGFVFELVEESEKNRGGYVVGDIGDNGVVASYWYVLQHITLDDIEIHSHGNDEILLAYT